MQLSQLRMWDGEETISDKPSDSFGSFREVAEQEQGLLLKSDAAAVLGVTHQTLCDLVDRKRLQSWKFLGKVWVSAREVAARKNGPPLKAGRPKSIFVPTGADKV